MGCCSARCVLLTISVMQLVLTVERQVFDFLGYMWVPIVGNFFQIIFAILGFFGTYQYRPKYITAYVVWMFFWLAANVFVICFYLQLGSLDRDGSLLNLATGSRSWWEDHGPGCVASYNATYLGEEAWRKPYLVEGCLVHYYYVECGQAALQILLAVFGFIGGCYLIRVFSREDDSSQTRRNVPIVPYSIEYQRHSSRENPYQRPMTPRKVKRRSTRFKRSGSCRQSYYQNPVTKLMERSVDSSTSNDSYSRYPLPPYRPGLGRQNPGYNYRTEELEPPPPPLPPMTRPRQGHINLGFQSRPVSIHNGGRPSPIYMNDSETVI